MTPEEIEQMKKENQQLKDDVTLQRNKYKKLADKVKETLDCQQAYFKSGKDVQVLRRSKALETELREMVNPPVSKQAGLWNEYLAQ